MVIYDISAINGTSLDVTYTGIITMAPWLSPLILAFEFIIIMLGGVYAQNRRIGFSNVPMWGAIAGLVTTTSAFILTAINGVVNLETLGILIALTIGFAFWFFFQDLD
jgi:hypothetical protein